MKSILATLLPASFQPRPKAIKGVPPCRKERKGTLSAKSARHILSQRPESCHLSTTETLGQRQVVGDSHPGGLSRVAQACSPIAGESLLGFQGQPGPGEMTQL